jgi:hypothetical protein
LKPRILEAARALIRSNVRAGQLGGRELVAAGACTEEEFNHSFADARTFQRELAAELFGDARDAVIRATNGMHSGVEQLIRAYSAYLDYNLTHPALQEIAHLIQFDPIGYEMLQRMEVGVALVARADLEAAGADNCNARARLLTSMAVVVVRAEFKAGRALPELRDALFDYCLRSVAHSAARVA